MLATHTCYFSSVQPRHRQRYRSPLNSRFQQQRRNHSRNAYYNRKDRQSYVSGLVELGGGRAVLSGDGEFHSSRIDDFAQVIGQGPVTVYTQDGAFGPGCREGISSDR